MIANHIHDALAQVRELQKKILEKQRFNPNNAFEKNNKPQRAQRTRRNTKINIF
ncbi:MAG: hypothetical protein ACE5HI_14205 [bacterium]